MIPSATIAPPTAIKAKAPAEYTAHKVEAIDEEEARKTLALWEEIAAEHAKEGMDPFGVPLEESSLRADGEKRS